MEKYNLLYVIKENPELRIILSNKLESYIKENSEESVLNYGDFYSKIPISRLPKIIYKSLEDYERNQIIIKKSDRIVLENQIDYHKKYLIKEEDGITIYLPQKRMYTPQTLEFVYRTFSSRFMKNLFSSEKKGTLQNSHLKIQKVTERNNSEELYDKLKYLYENASYLNEGCDKKIKRFEVMRDLLEKSKVKKISKNIN